MFVHNPSISRMVGSPLRIDVGQDVLTFEIVDAFLQIARNYRTVYQAKMPITPDIRREFPIEGGRLLFVFRKNKGRFSIMVDVPREIPVRVDKR